MSGLIDKLSRSSAGNALKRLLSRSEYGRNLRSQVGAYRAQIDAVPPGMEQELARLKRENDAIYSMLYDAAHDIDEPARFATRSTVAAFGHQWANMQEGAFMLSDPQFKADVERIISQEEIQLDRSWFPGKSVVDAGCGGGRWSYGLAKLGAKVTAVDINRSAIEATRKALNELGAQANFVNSELETVSEKLPKESFDLVWSWGVLHHCHSFSGALKSVASLVKPGGLIHLYLYGRESIPLKDDVDLFKERMRYNYLPSDEARYAFLEEKAAIHGLDVHHVHDIYAPLINRRLTFDEIKGMLENLGFTHVERMISHSEVWVQAVKGDSVEQYAKYRLPKPKAPYWFQRDSGVT